MYAVYTPHTLKCMLGVSIFVVHAHVYLHDVHVSFCVYFDIHVFTNTCVAFTNTCVSTHVYISLCRLTQRVYIYIYIYTCMYVRISLGT